jgi:glyoxylase I family protein
MADIEQHLQELELKLLRPIIRRSPESLSSLLADDFREFASSGRVFTKEEMIGVLRTESRAEFFISDFRAQVLGTGVALVTYQAVRHDEPDHSQAASLRSSLWVIRDGKWQMLFHQGTKLPPR